MKSRRKMSEKLIEQGRKGNKGCYAVSWLFLLALVALGSFQPQIMRRVLVFLQEWNVSRETFHSPVY